jgi:hypothetical protein
MSVVSSFPHKCHWKLEAHGWKYNASVTYTHCMSQTEWPHDLPVVRSAGTIQEYTECSGSFRERLTHTITVSE